MKRVTFWLILISYVFMVFGNVVEAGCCRNEAAHAAGEHTAHEHAHSKVLVLVHSLSHSSVPEDLQRLVSSHCCCVSQRYQEPGLTPHSLTRQSSTPGNPDLASQTIFPGGAAFLATSPIAGPSHMHDHLGAAFTLQSIRSTILLI
ncbi:MAG: hypothetical protein FJY85_12710 [Deltaproteobacteria bacterium]|nr:hypothetical protein [Deltaproteobacteria bacterium]